MPDGMEVPRFCHHCHLSLVALVGCNVKRFLLWLFPAVLLGQSLDADAQQVTLRATLQVAVSEPYLGVPLVHLKDEVERRSNNTVSIQIIDKGKLYIDTQVVGGVASGAVEMGVAGTYQFAKALPEIAIIEQPFLFNFEALIRAATSPGSEMRKLIDEAILEKAGVRVLWWQPVGGSVFFSKGMDVAEPHVIRNRKVRVFSQVTAQLTTRCGGHPTIISTSKMHDAMKDGAVDLAMGSVTSVEPRGLWKVADTITRTDHAPIEFLLLVNEKAWQALSPDHRIVIAEAAREVERVARDRFTRNEASAYAFAREKGMQIRAVTADQVAEWRACSAGVLEDYMSAGGDLARRLLAAYGRLRADPCCTSGPSPSPFRGH
jgi:C4-dicarboxylate-binding protein DctP